MLLETLDQIVYWEKGALVVCSKDGLMKRLLSSAKPGTGMVIAVKKLNHESFQGHKEWLVRELHQIIKIFCFLINGCLE